MANQRALINGCLAFCDGLARSVRGSDVTPSTFLKTASGLAVQSLEAPEMHMLLLLYNLQPLTL